MQNNIKMEFTLVGTLLFVVAPVAAGFIYSLVRPQGKRELTPLVMLCTLVAAIIGRMAYFFYLDIEPKKEVVLLLISIFIFTPLLSVISLIKGIYSLFDNRKKPSAIIQILVPIGTLAAIIGLLLFIPWGIDP